MTVFEPFQIKKPNESLDKSYESVRQFGYSLFAQCICDRNPVLSPVSAYLALAMAGCGADGTTKEEFYNVLGQDMMALSNDMMKFFLAQGDLLNLSIANSAWLHNKFAVHDTWADNIKSLMSAEVFWVDLGAIETMNAVNRWVFDKTNGLIRKMLEAPLVGRYALFNTIYFKGRWMIPFETDDTDGETFYLNNGNTSKWLARLWGNRQKMTVQVDMMNMHEKELFYLSNNFAEGVILPYRKNNNNDPNMAFVALKPTGNGNIRRVYSSLTSSVLKEMLANRKMEIVDLKLPKFEIELFRILNSSLFNMGLRECFDGNKADFTLMAEKQNGDNLFIDFVMQKAKIIVDEQGTEAAAATQVGLRCLGIHKKELFFDEPFLYMIMDMDREIPLFMGILDNPAV
ncbi:MAG: serpin family protein [Lachnospiraceae bacterium]|nr:serpin family protein [Lachnospiraceae bacterium]